MFGMLVNMPNKYQRRLKLSLIKKHFESLRIEYSPFRDVYEAYNNDRFMLAIEASKNIQEIIDQIRIKKEI